jgi:hypothetical protein
MLEVTTIAIAGGEVCGIDDGDCDASASSAIYGGTPGERQERDT